KKVYEARCAMCHGTLAAKKPVLPSATDFFKGQYKLTGGDAKKIEKVIKEGAAKAFPGKGSPAMAPVALADKERADVTAFIKTLKGK
ncbi:MAG: cytochrome c, partial [Candidatus Sericytochromatia bacterium]|nr:cytochrome c [Candidatus Tanganyikabacteria bacterium]